MILELETLEWKKRGEGDPGIESLRPGDGVFLLSFITNLNLNSIKS